MVCVVFHMSIFISSCLKLQHLKIHDYNFMGMSHLLFFQEKTAALFGCTIAEYNTLILCPCLTSIFAKTILGCQIDHCFTSQPPSEECWFSSLFFFLFFYCDTKMHFCRVVVCSHSRSHELLQWSMCPCTYCRRALSLLSRFFLLFSFSIHGAAPLGMQTQSHSSVDDSISPFVTPKKCSVPEFPHG